MKYILSNMQFNRNNAGRNVAALNFMRGPAACMTSSVAIAAFILTFLSACHSSGSEIVHPTTVLDLNERRVLGELGIPLGQAAMLEAVIVSGNELGGKAEAGRYFLRVDALDGKAIASAPVLAFTIPGFADVQLANDAFSLHAIKMGQTASHLDSIQVKSLEEEYVGRRVKILAYETGGFSGIPFKWPDADVGVLPIWQDSEFQFASRLVVLKQYE